MKPSYTLSAPLGTGTINLATKAKQVEVWLAQLQGYDIPERVTLLTAYLNEHDRPDLPAAFRRQILDLVGPVIGTLLRNLELGLRDMPLPMEAGQRKRVDAVVLLLLAVGSMNKRLILEFAEYTPRLFGSNPLPGHIAGFLHSALQLLDICYLSHSQIPDGFWRDLHQTAQLIFAADLLETADPTGRASSLIAIYTAMVLEAIADPYHFAEQERLWLRDVIKRLGPLAKVENARAPSHKGVYGIRVMEDKVPYPLAWRKGTEPDCELVLNTTGPARKLALAISRIEQGRYDEQAMPLLRHPAYKALLQRLKLLWGGSMRRTTPRRVPTQPVQSRVMLGFHAIHKYLSGSFEAQDAGSIISGRVINESLGGMALVVQKPNFHLKVGALVFLSRGAGDAFSELGMIRWFRTRSDGVLTFGIKFLRGRADGVTVFSGDGRHVYPGVLVSNENGGPESGSDASSGKLILPPVRLEADSRVEVRQDGVRSALLLTEKLEGLNDIDLFRCQPDRSGQAA
jgi:hypothetical protein